MQKAATDLFATDHVLNIDDKRGKAVNRCLRQSCRRVIYLRPMPTMSSIGSMGGRPRCVLPFSCFEAFLTSAGILSETRRDFSWCSSRLIAGQMQMGSPWLSDNLRNTVWSASGCCGWRFCCWRRACCSWSRPSINRRSSAAPRRCNSSLFLTDLGRPCTSRVDRRW